MARSKAPSSCFGPKKQRLDGESSNRVNRPTSGLRTPGVVRREMCFYCFDVLHCHLRKLESPGPPSTFPNSSYPLFVTWSIGKNETLRGCIGTFTALNIHSGLKEYAIISAMKDSRFSPITEDEFPHLTCSISLLLHFEEGKHCRDWQIGVHGIRIEFYDDKKCRRTATFLPEVPSKQGWNHSETIDSLIRKGGYRGTINEAFRQTIRLTRYQSEKISVPAVEYMRSRQNGYCV